MSKDKFLNKNVQKRLANIMFLSILLTSLPIAITAAQLVCAPQISYLQMTVESTLGILSFIISLASQFATEKIGTCIGHKFKFFATPKELQRTESQPMVNQISQQHNLG